MYRNDQINHKIQHFQLEYYKQLIKKGKFRLVKFSKKARIRTRLADKNLNPYYQRNQNQTPFLEIYLSFYEMKEYILQTLDQIFLGTFEDNYLVECKPYGKQSQ